MPGTGAGHTLAAAGVRGPEENLSYLAISYSKLIHSIISSNKSFEIHSFYHIFQEVIRSEACIRKNTYDKYCNA